MKTAGIIAEYNPFHNGHRYQIETLRTTYHPDYVIIAMSGDFLQRGTPAMMDKYARARMALMQGADLVLELPACFATASAELFALGGVLLFHTTGLVNSICFGAESNDFEEILALAQLLAKEPDWYRDALTSYLKQGISFPAARARALPEYKSLLRSPNNILAVEYCKAIFALHSSLTPIPVARIGSGYHDADLSAPFASASAIRKRLHSWVLQDTSREIPAALFHVLPENSLHIMKDYCQSLPLLWENDFSLLLHHCLLLESEHSLLACSDMTKPLANRILGKRKDFLSWSSFCDSLNSKDTTYARISRILTHLLLHITRTQTALYLNPDSRPSFLPYLRVLGFSKSASGLLARLKETAKAPVITSLSAGEAALGPEGLAMLQTDVFAADLYRSVQISHTHNPCPNEYSRRLLTV